MSATALNIHEFYNELKSAGFNEQQAEVIANIQSKTATWAIEQARHEYQLDGLVIKRDLKELELRLSAKIRESELSLEAKIADSKAELVRWVIGAGFLQVALIAGLILRLADKV
jgi:NAD-dependent DNA ligase